MTRCFASLNMTNGIFGGAELSAHKQELHTKCATKVAPPILPFLLLWDSTPSLAEGVGGGSLRASPLGERGNQPYAKLES